MSLIFLDGNTATSTIEGFEGRIVFPEVMDKQTYKAVSYTHLDVYKRQLWQHTSSADGPAHGVQSDRIDLNRFNGTVTQFNEWSAVTLSLIHI